MGATKPGDDSADGAGEGSGRRVAERFERRRNDIVAAAIPVLNEHGLKGMRLTAVAEEIGLKSTGVTYYFSRKEELAVACVEEGLSAFHELLNCAEQQSTAGGRLRALICAFVERHAAVRRGEVTPLPSFAPIRCLEGEHRRRMGADYRQMFRRARSLLEAPDLEGLDVGARSVRMLILLEQLYWASTWLGHYDLDEYPRVADRLADILLNGFCAPEAQLAITPLPASERDHGADAESREQFLRAAAREINIHGYRGASVDRIAASLNLTKGAFYHHNDAKDDLVTACFRRTFARFREARLCVAKRPESEWWRLTTSVATLVDFQLGEFGPMIQTSALSSMPAEHRAEIIDLSERVSRSFAAMISDAIAEGTVRPVDAAIAAVVLVAAVNAAADSRGRSPPARDRWPDAYVRPLFRGLLSI